MIGKYKKPQRETQVFLVLGLMLSLLSFPVFAEGSSHWSSGNSSAHLDEAKREALERKALDGDVEAAKRIVDYYEYGARADVTKYTDEDKKKIVIWLYIAMSDGDVNSQEMLGSTLTGNVSGYDVTSESCEHGRELLIDAQKKGNKAAAAVLSRVGPDCKRYDQHSTPPIQHQAHDLPL